MDEYEIISEVLDLRIEAERLRKENKKLTDEVKALKQINSLHQSQIVWLRRLIERLEVEHGID